MTPVHPTRTLLAATLAASCGFAALSPAAIAAKDSPAVVAVTRIIAGGLKTGLLPDLRQGGAPEAVIACVQEVQPEAFADSVDRLFDAALTPAQRREFDDYMAGPVGQRELAVTLAGERASGAPDVPPLTAAERAAVAAFENSETGKTFSVALKASLDDSDTDGTVGGRMREVLAGCLQR